VDDEEQLVETTSALTTLGFSDNMVTNIFRMLVSILHLGNINISGASDMDDSAIQDLTNT